MKLGGREARRFGCWKAMRFTILYASKLPGVPAFQPLKLTRNKLLKNV